MQGKCESCNGVMGEKPGKNCQDFAHQASYDMTKNGCACGFCGQYFSIVEMQKHNCRQGKPKIYFDGKNFRSKPRKIF